MKKYLKIASAALFASATLGFSSAAHAECSSGFLANLACEAGIIDQETAQAADRVNAQMGQPVDHAITQGMDAVVPGSGTAVEGYWAAQRAAERFKQPSQPQYRAPAPSGNSQPQYQPRMSNVCLTQFGPIMVHQMVSPMYAGQPCWVSTPYGNASGVAQ